MANVIIEQLGRGPLIDEIGNPFCFFSLYKQAADMKGGDTPSFSDSAIELVQELEERYLR
jgi:hypothetical protein